MPGLQSQIDEIIAGVKSGRISEATLNKSVKYTLELIFKSISYKNWDFSFFFQGIARTSFMVKDFHPFGDSMLRNVLSWVADERWSPDNQNTNATYPRLSRKTNNNNNKLSSYWERNGAFLKLKNAEIGYTYKNMRLYISGSNLMTFAPFDLWDPEQGGGSGLSYPTQRVFNIGFQMTINNK